MPEAYLNVKRQFHILQMTQNNLTFHVVVWGLSEGLSILSPSGVIQRQQKQMFCLYCCVVIHMHTFTEMNASI